MLQVSADAAALTRRLTALADVMKTVFTSSISSTSAFENDVSAAPVALAVPAAFTLFAAVRSTAFDFCSHKSNAIVHHRNSHTFTKM